MLVPKAEELVANPYRHDGKDGAKQFFEEGFREVFARARETASTTSRSPSTTRSSNPTSSDDGDGSTGWETLLDGMIRSGWAITATWPMRSELGNRMLSHGTNALASSIVLALRPRPDDAPTTDRRGLIAALQAELPDALRELQQGAIAPVDLPQAAIGPGMAVFSRYAKVIETDGSPMTVRSALARINEILDQVLNEQEGDFDATTRFAIAWYRQHGYGTGKFGDADDLARARNTSVETMDRDGILTSAAGKVTLLSPANCPTTTTSPRTSEISAWEVLHHLIAVLERDGIVPAAGLPRRGAEPARRRDRRRAGQGAGVPAVLDRREERLDEGRARLQHPRHRLAGHPRRREGKCRQPAGTGQLRPGRTDMGFQTPLYELPTTSTGRPAGRSSYPTSSAATSGRTSGSGTARHDPARTPVGRGDAAEDRQRPGAVQA